MRRFPVFGAPGALITTIAPIFPEEFERTCSSCRSVNKNLTCGRAWTCPACGARHDRGLNAALNMMSRYLEAAAVWPGG